GISAAGLWSFKTLPIDAFPDISAPQVQVIIKAPGMSPSEVEQRITFPIEMEMQGIPGQTVLRSTTKYSLSVIVIDFEDDMDIYLARNLVTERLNQVWAALPEDIEGGLAPITTPLGEIFMYRIKGENYSNQELRSLQDWVIRPHLRKVEGVADVNSLGGEVRNYEVVIKPEALVKHGISIDEVEHALKESNRNAGGDRINRKDEVLLVRTVGKLNGMKDIKNITVRTRYGQPVHISDVADVRVGSMTRYGAVTADGEGEVVGGIVVMRSGENALRTIQRVKDKLEILKKSLPSNIEIVETYDRSQLINKGVDNLSFRLLEELVVVILICGLFLYHFRSSLVILISLPIGILIAFGIMNAQGITANIMSLGGIAIAIGAMVDASIVMIENVHKHLERALTDCKVTNRESNWTKSDKRLQIIINGAVEVGKPLFYSLLIITFSFLPIFTLEAQEARLFLPLAFTKTYAMAVAAGLSITLVPVLIVFLVKGNIRSESENPFSRSLSNLYQPIIKRALNKPILTLALTLIIVLSAAFPVSQLGGEFMPDMDEGDLLYMPTTLPGISIGKAKEILQQTDKMIKSVPEVRQVFGKVGRADTATDPAPLTMIESTILLKDKSEWREGMNLQKIIKELDQRVQIPSLSNAWLMPIRTRIDMQSTGINTPIGLKISGPDLSVIQELGMKIEAVLGGMDETASVYSERANDARYININVDRYAAAHFGLSVAEILETASIAIGGKDIVYNVEGRERYAINLRYPQGMRDSIEKLKSLQLIATEDTHVQLQDLAEISLGAGPPIIKSENGRLNSWVHVTQQGSDIAGYVSVAKELIEMQVSLPSGYVIEWAGQYQFMQRAKARMQLIIPVTLFIILILLYFCFKSFIESAIVMLSVPLALVGGAWLQYFLGYNFSIASAVGFIALAGVAAEFGIVMLVYLNEAVKRLKPTDKASLYLAVVDGAVNRVRPKAMTAAVIIVGLLPVMIAEGTGSEVMHRIVAPMLGGMITAPLVSMVLIPIVYFLWKERTFEY
ncbi:MAG: CusA/CzcA family heavy metal efflux RND transporter, partial [Kangiellaceae bacterium]|nr:CusA/CzcA family heavy metal efflux RND transporter [Kangiellaceae bacterium]